MYTRVCSKRSLHHPRLSSHTYPTPPALSLRVLHLPQMVTESIKALKERNGSSIQAIKKHITATYPTLNFTPHQMRSALKKGTEAGKFIKVSLLEWQLLPLISARCCVRYRVLRVTWDRAGIIRSRFSFLLFRSLLFSTGRYHGFKILPSTGMNDICCRW